MSVIQNDSWKLWEAFFAGCCVISVNLDLYNIKFPVQPKNMIDYIGITLNEEEDLDLLLLGVCLLNSPGIRPVCFGKTCHFFLGCGS